MSCSVKKSAPVLVRPAEPTPAGTLPFSALDLPLRWLLMDAVLVYGGPGPSEPAKLVREALSKALVHYYPVAGRIIDYAAPGPPGISCNGEGVWFVEATAGCSLEDVGYLDGWPRAMPDEHLLPSPVPHQPPEYAPNLLIQVTQFQCGGFALGISFNHSIFDGVGIGQFMKAVAEAAEGHSQPTVKPVWLREKLPRPARLTRPFPPLPEPSNFVTSIIDISSDCMNSMKQDYFTSTGGKCTVFEILAAKIWQSRVRAIGFAPDREVPLSYAADIRKFQEALPSEGGYYGNCIYQGSIRATAGQIMNASLVEIISLVKNSKDGVRAKFLKWLEGDVEEDPFQSNLSYEAMQLVDWRMIGLSEVVLGSKVPMHVIHVNNSDFLGFGLLLRPPLPKQGVRLLLHCVRKEHLESFYDEMNTISSCTTFESN